MKITVDERIKHRIIGLLVITAIAVIILPAIINQSNYYVDEQSHNSVSIKEIRIEHKKISSRKPPRIQPAINSHIKLPSTIYPIVFLPKTMPQSLQTISAKAKIVAIPIVKSPVAVLKKAREKKQINRPQRTMKESYMVQLASFAQLRNALALIQQLQSKGYKASYTKIFVKDGALFKVTVGGVANRNEAYVLQQKLAKDVKLNGYIIQLGEK
ncbi:MAG: SPOR domain-containing protein [Legionella sp.]